MAGPLTLQLPAAAATFYATRTALAEDVLTSVHASLIRSEGAGGGDDAAWQRVELLERALQKGLQSHRDAQQGALEGLPQRVTEAWRGVASLDAAATEGRLLRELEDMRRTVEHSVRQQTLEMTGACERLKAAQGDVNVAEVMSQAMGGVLTGMSSQTGVMMQLKQQVEDVTRSVTEMRAWMQEQQVRQMVSHQKGHDGEQRLMERLTEALPWREGYRVVGKGGVAHCADVHVQRAGYPDVAIECKAYKGKVPREEVEKFQGDMKRMNDKHGLFVSLHSGIAGMQRVELEQLPTGKYAVYLAHNEYDVDMIATWLHALYRLDELSRKTEGEEGVVKLSREEVQRVRQVLESLTAKVRRLKDNTRENLSLLNELTFEVLERLLAGKGAPGQKGGAAEDRGRPRAACPECGKELSAHHLARHVKACRNKRPATGSDVTIESVLPPS